MSKALQLYTMLSEFPYGWKLITTRRCGYSGGDHQHSRGNSGRCEDNSIYLTTPFIVSGTSLLRHSFNPALLVEVKQFSMLPHRVLPHMSCMADLHQ